MDNFTVEYTGKIAQAKTARNSLFLKRESSQTSLALTQYIPLPAYRTTQPPPTDFSETFDNLRTPMFFAMFAVVLLVQIYMKKKKADQADKEMYEKAGPMEKALLGKGPGGKRLSEKQVKEVRELDDMLGNMGNMVGDMTDKLKF